MRYKLLLSLSILASAICGGQTFGQQCTQANCEEPSMWHYIYYRNTRWPEPFRAQDTMAVLQMFEAQRNNGWKLQNTIGQAMFDARTCQLTDAGEAHIRWILTQAPLDRRSVFVFQADDQATTAKRVEAVQLVISKMIPVGQLPPVYLTDRDAPTSPGSYQTTLQRALSNSIPSPRLTSQGSSGSSGSGSGSSSP